MIRDEEVVRYVQRSEVIERDSIVLDTIRKSGTNYLRIIVSNYLNLLYSGSEERISYSDMKEMFPNQRDFVLFPEKYVEFNVQKEVVGIRDDHFIKKAGYSDFLFGHDDFEYHQFSSARKIIHLYRNPLDMCVSYYYFSYKNRIGSEYKKEEKIDLAISHLIKYYMQHYVFMKEFSAKSDKVMRLSYESLYRNTFDVVYILFKWLNFPIHVGKIRLAIENSSIKKAREEERVLGRAVVMPKNSTFTGSFVRSGNIGQWKEHFTTVEVQTLVRLLKKYGICVDEFVME